MRIFCGTCIVLALTSMAAGQPAPRRYVWNGKLISPVQVGIDYGRPQNTDYVVDGEPLLFTVGDACSTSQNRRHSALGTDWPDRMANCR